MAGLVRITVEVDGVLLRFTQDQENPFHWEWENGHVKNGETTWTTVPVHEPMTGQDVLWEAARLVMGPDHPDTGGGT